MTSPSAVYFRMAKYAKEHPCLEHSMIKNFGHPKVKIQYVDLRSVVIMFIIMNQILWSLIAEPSYENLVILSPTLKFFGRKINHSLGANRVMNK